MLDGTGGGTVGTEGTGRACVVNALAEECAALGGSFYDIATLWLYATQRGVKLVRPGPSLLAMANILPRQKQIAVLSALVEGVSVRSAERMLDVSRETVLSLLMRGGEGCATLHNRMMRNLSCKRIECDEIWAFVQKKQRHLDPRG